LALAAGEAGQITNVPFRLTRQLNIADLQSQRGQKENASKSLAAARATISGAGEALSTRVSMAGYVSVSQLARRVNDTALAASACEDALTLLRTVEPLEQRVPYVYGLASELKQLHGDERASKFVREAGPWAAAIDDVEDRRTALLMFADSLFDCEDYDGGLAVLRHDDDPAWRSERLEEMANASYRQEAAMKANPYASRRNVGSGAYSDLSPSRSGEALHGPAPAEAKRDSNYSLQMDLRFDTQFKGRERPAE